MRKHAVRLLPVMVVMGLYIEPVATFFSPIASNNDRRHRPFYSSELQLGTTLPNDTNEVLASLFGSAENRDKFFHLDKGVNVVHFQRALAEHEAPLQDVGIESLYNSSDFINLRKRGTVTALNKTQMNFQDFEHYIQGGGSAVVSIVDEVAFMQLKYDLERLFEVETCMNVYHSGPKAVALNRHYDSYDVLVLQLDGNKDWEYLVDTDTWVNTTLLPGDLLYVPKGVFHAATTADGFSSTTHLTIGLLD